MIGSDLHFRNRSAAHFDDRIILMKIAAGELVRLHDRNDFFNAVQGCQMILVDQSLFAHSPDDGAKPPLTEMRLAAHALDFADHAVDSRLGRVRIHDDDQGKSPRRTGLFSLPVGKRAILEAKVGLYKCGRRDGNTNAKTGPEAPI